MNVQLRQDQTWTGAILAATFVLLTGPAWTHCDTLEGPVVQDARKALENGDVMPVLKWIDEQHEQEIRDAFASALEVRAESDSARALADRYFFETLVRVHRATEGFGYTGLKPHTTVDPAILEADASLESGSADVLIEHLSHQVVTELRERFNEAREKKRHAEESVSQGREYVAAYVRFTHFVEAIREAVKADDFHHAAAHEEEHNDDD